MTSANIETMNTRVADAKLVWWKRNLTVGLVILNVVMVVMIGTLLALQLSYRSSRAAHNETLNRIDTNTQYVKCIAKAEGAGFGASAQAFSAPPAPNPARLAAVNKLFQIGQSLEDPDTLCKEFIR